MVVVKWIAWLARDQKVVGSNRGSPIFYVEPATIKKFLVLVAWQNKLKKEKSTDKKVFVQVKWKLAKSLSW